MRLRRFLSGLLVSCMLIGCLPTEMLVQAKEQDTEVVAMDEQTAVPEEQNADDTSSVSAPKDKSWLEEEPELLQVDAAATRFPDKRVLLIQDNLPWKSNANTSVLSAIAPYEVVKTSDVAQKRLEDYDMVVMANDQTYTTYGNFGEVRDLLEQYVNAGGVLILGACDGGWANGYINSELPGGISKKNSNEYHNYVVDSNHPIVTTSYTEGIAVADAQWYNNYCSHIYFVESSLPNGTNIILKNQSGHPTLIEFPLGNGTIVASGLTWEHNWNHTGYGNFAKRALDDMFIYGLMVSNGDRKITPTITYTVAADKVAIYVGDTETKEPLKDASVTVNGITATTNEYGIAELDLATGEYQVTITAKGYLKKNTNLDLEQGQVKGSYMFKEGVTVEPSLDEAKLITTTGEKYDLINQRIYFTKGEKTEVTYKITTEMVGKTVDYYLLSQGTTQVKLTSATGTIAPGLKFSPEKPIYFEIVCTDGSRSKKLKTGIFIKEASSGFLGTDKNASLEFRFGQGLGITIPGNLPVIGGSKFDIGLGSFPVSITTSNNKVQIGVGITDIQKMKDNWTNYVKQVDAACDTMDKLDKLEELNKAYGAKSGGFTLKKGWAKPTFSLKGYVEATWDENKKTLTSVSGKLVGAVEFKYNYNQQFIVGPVPVYFEIGAGFKFELAPEIRAVLLEKNEFQYSVPFTFTPSFTIGGGAGINGAISVGAEGTASLPITLNFTQQTANVKLTGSMKLKASLLFVFKAEKEIAKGTWVIYDGALGKNAAANETGDEEVLLQYNDYSEYELMDRDYLANMSEWDGEISELLQGDALKDYEKTIQSSVLPGTIPQIATVGGKTVMVFQADNKSKNVTDCVSLMYSVLSESGWSTPQYVWKNNGEADYYAQLKVIGDNCYLVWQKAKTKAEEAVTVSGGDLEDDENLVTVSGGDLDAAAVSGGDLIDDEDPDDLLEAEGDLDKDTDVIGLAKQMEIAFARFDAATNSFIDQAYLTNNDGYDGSATIAGKSDGTVVVSWVSNASGDILKAGTSSDIMYASKKAGGSFGAAKKAGSTTAYILQMDSAYVNDAFCIAYTADKDGNLNTVNDVECYLYKGGKTVALTNDSVANMNPRFVGNKIYWYEENKIIGYDLETKDKAEFAEASSCYQIVNTSNGDVILYTTPVDEDTENICLYNPATEKRVVLASITGGIANFSAVCDENGSFHIVYNKQMKGSKRNDLMYFKSAIANDLTLKSVSVDESLCKEQNQPATIKVTNNGVAEAQGFKVEVCENGSLIDTISFEDAIAPGETKEFDLEFYRKTINAVKNYKFTVVNNQDKDQSNNSYEIEGLGYPDLALEVSEYYIGEKVDIFTNVRGLTPRTCDAVLRVYEDDENGEVLFSRDLTNVSSASSQFVRISLDRNKMNLKAGQDKNFVVKVEPKNISDQEQYTNDNTYDLFIGSLKQEITGVELESGKKVLVLDYDQYKSKTYALKAQTFPAGVKTTLTWSSSNKKAAVVDASGKLTVKGTGETVITAAVDETTKASVKVRVVKISKTAPTGLKAGAVSGTQIELSWNSLKDFENYEIYRSTSKDGKYKLALRANGSTQAQDIDVEVGNTYYYKVRGYINDHGTNLYTSFSSPVSAEIKLNAPSSIYASVNGLNRSYISWSSVSGVDKYYIYRSTKEKGTYTKIGQTTSTYYYDDKAQIGNTYYYKITSVKGKKQSAFSNVASVKMILQSPYISVYMNNNALGCIPYININAVSGVTGYEVYRADTYDGKYALIERTRNTLVYDKKAKLGKTYFYKAKAFLDVNGKRIYSELSDYRSITVNLTAPYINNIQAAGEGQMYLEWNPVAGATAYEVYSCDSYYGEYKKIATTKDTFYVATKLKADTYTYFKLKAICVDKKARYESEFSSYRGGYPGFSKPYNVTVTFDGKNDILKFPKVAGAKYIEIWHYDSMNGYGDKPIAKSTGTSYTYKNAKLGKSEAFRLRAYRKVGGQEQWSDYTYITASNAADPVEKVTVSNVSAKSLKVSWAASKQANGYDVYRSDSYSGYYYWVGTTEKKSATSYIDKDLVPGKGYFYKVKPYSTVDGYKCQGEYSDIAYASTMLPVLKATAVGQMDCVSLSWDMAKDASGYEVYRSTGKNEAYTLLKTLDKATVTKFADKKVEFGKKYYYVVRAFYTVSGSDTKYYTDYSAPIQGGACVPVPAISKLGQKTNTGKPELSWKPQNGVKGYEIYRSTKEKSGYTKVKTISSGKTKSWVDTKAKVGTKYYYKIRSYAIVNKKKLYSADSASKSILVVPLKVKLTKATSKKGKGVTLTWKTVKDVTGYEISRSTKKNGKYTVLKPLVNKANKKTFVDTKAKARTTYYYRVRAYKKVGAKKVYGDYSVSKKVVCK